MNTRKLLISLKYQIVKETIICISDIRKIRKYLLLKYLSLENSIETHELKCCIEFIEFLDFFFEFIELIEFIEVIEFIEFMITRMIFT